MFDPPYLHPEYLATRLRAPREEPLAAPAEAFDAPVCAVPRAFAGVGGDDLTAHGRAAPLGERLIVTGRVVDERGRPLRAALVEIWQANAAGRYDHPADTHDAPLDPNFKGIGRALTDDEGAYRFVTIRPGAYPWKNHAFAWRPQHIHFSLLGHVPAQRLVTQMYFPGDPLLERDPIFNSVPEAARGRLVATLAPETGIEGVALGYRFDIVLAGAAATPPGSR